MIELKNISLSYGARKIFDGISCSINRKDRIGLAGLNGAGKTTLLRILSGEETPDFGEIEKANFAEIGYLKQEEIVAGNRELFIEAESAFDDVVALRKRESALDKIIASASPDSPEYLAALDSMGEIRHKLDFSEEIKLKSRVESVLMGLGFKMSDMNRPCREFSGGMQMRVALAKLLLKEPSLLMLDEPTNHLDIESVAWLEDWLKSYGGAVLLVSHDKALLNALCSRIWHLERGRLDTYSGNYDDFLRESSARAENLERAASNQRKKIEKTERFIERFRYKASKAAQVQSRIKALEKIDLIQTGESEKKIKFSFPPSKRCSQVVLEVSEVSKSFGNKEVLKNISFRIERGEKVALVGVNGAGKSTLAKIIAGELEADSGSVKLGNDVEMSYFAQHQTDTLDKTNDVLTEASEFAPMSRKSDVRNLLGAFLFSGDDVLKSVGVLSGGEKNRLALAKMLLREFNFLLLDEPTNHLDINSKAVLQKSISSYDGTLLIVSHDRDFLDPLVSKVMELSPSGLRFFEGNLSDYVEKIEKEGKIFLKNKSPKKSSDRKAVKAAEAAARIERGKLKRSVEELERKIEAAESGIIQIENEMSSPDFHKFGERCAQISNEYNSLKKELSLLYKEWESAVDKYSNFDASSLS